MKFPDYTGPDLNVAFKQLLNWCRATRILGVNGIRAKEGPNGSWLTLDLGDDEASAADKQIPFAIRSIKRTVAEGVPDEYTIIFYPGWVREIVTTSGEGADAVIYHMPTSASIALDDDPPPEIGVEAGDYVYVKYLTDKQGNITETPTMVVSSEVEDSTHYQPADGDGSGGVNGTYYVQIGQFLSYGDAGVKWVPLINSDVVHVQELWTGTNLGSGGRFFKKRDPDANEYQFRTVVGNYGLRYDENPDDLSLDFDAENLGAGTYGCEVLVVPEPEEGDPLPDDKAQFRAIRALQDAEEVGTTPQIRVEYGDGDGSEVGAGDTIIVRGNGKNKALIFMDDAASPAEIDRVSWSDGLVVEDANVTITIPTSGSYAHPWKCTPTGGSSITVAAGKVMGIISGAGGGPHYFSYAPWDEANVAISASGWLYAVATGSFDELIDDAGADYGTLAGVSASGTLQTTRTFSPASVTVTFDVSEPSSVGSGTAGEIWVPIAQIDLTAGVATVVDVVLTHNPLLAVERASYI